MALTTRHFSPYHRHDRFPQSLEQCHATYAPGTTPSQQPPAFIGDFSPALTTTTLNRNSSKRYEASFCRAAQEVLHPAGAGIGKLLYNFVKLQIVQPGFERDFHLELVSVASERASVQFL